MAKKSIILIALVLIAAGSFSVTEAKAALSAPAEIPTDARIAPAELTAISGPRLLAQQGVKDALEGLEATAGSSGAGLDITKKDLSQEVGRIIFAILGFVGVVFLLLVIAGGFLWMTAGGNADQVKKGRDLLKNGFIGVVIITASYAITWFVINNVIGGAT